MRAGADVMKRVRPERSVKAVGSGKSSSKVPTDDFFNDDDNYSNTSNIDDFDHQQLVSQIKQLDNSLGGYWNSAPQTDSAGRRPRRKIERFTQESEDNKSNGDPTSPKKKIPKITPQKTTKKRIYDDFSDEEDSVSPSEMNSVSNGSEDESNVPKFTSPTLTGSAKRKSKVKPSKDFTPLKIRLMIDKAESSTVQRICDTANPTALIHDVSTYLLESYVSQPLILKQETRALVHIKDQDFLEKTKPLPQRRSKTPERPLPIVSKAEQQLKQFLRKRRVDAELIDRDLKSEKNKEIQIAKARFYGYLAENFTNDGSKKWITPSIPK